MYNSVTLSLYSSVILELIITRIRRPWRADVWHQSMIVQHSKTFESELKICTIGSLSGVSNSLLHCALHVGVCSPRPCLLQRRAHDNGRTEWLVFKIRFPPTMTLPKLSRREPIWLSVKSSCPPTVTLPKLSDWNTSTVTSKDAWWSPHIIFTDSRRPGDRVNPQWSSASSHQSLVHLYPLIISRARIVSLQIGATDGL